MGIDDRDYMGDRYRQRQGLGPGKTKWNDKKARQEELRAGHKKAVPLGSASWIGGGGSGSGSGHGGAWFDRANHGFDYQRNRYRPSPRLRAHPAGKWILLLSALTIMIPAYREVQRSGWIPDREVELPFPASGTVTVNNSASTRYSAGSAASRQAEQRRARPHRAARRPVQGTLPGFIRSEAGPSHARQQQAKAWATPRQRGADCTRPRRIRPLVSAIDCLDPCDPEVRSGFRLRLRSTASLAPSQRFNKLPTDLRGL